MMILWLPMTATTFCSSACVSCVATSVKASPLYSACAEPVDGLSELLAVAIAMGPAPRITDETIKEIVCLDDFTMCAAMDEVSPGQSLMVPFLYTQAT